MSIKIGVVFPQTEFGNDPQAIRDYAQTAEALGLSHVLAYDHVLGANPDRPDGWDGSYTHQDAFHEPFVLFGFMAGVTEKLEFATGIIILPQRQTALVAKQAAALDVLSGGRLRLGVGLGWNAVEFEALGEDFGNRGRRIEEQIALMRRLWTEPLVEFSGEWHSVQDAGLNPMPVQRPIPVWFGGKADAALRRAARLGDGWMPLPHTVARARRQLDKLYGYLAESGRTRAEFGIEPRMDYGDGDPAAWASEIEAWQAEGATHLSLHTMRAGFKSPAEHIDAIRHFAEALGLGQE